MATDTRCERRDFLAALAQLRSDFNAAKVDIKTREETLERALSELVGSVSIASNNSGLKKDNPLAQAVDNTNKKITASLENWRTDVNRYQRNTEFRENFGDSLLVYVYGKVKAGKSSIGNYVAYGHGDPHRSIIDAAEPTPEFFCEAIAEAEDAKKTEAELTAAELEEKRKLAAQRKVDDAQRKLDAQRILAEQRKFAVGACETTASIQRFKLSGLTWIDSPGLHSKTKPNGGLARDYVDAADLILYPMSSSQPGRETDLEEIAGLLQKGKRVEVVITRCDVTEEDVNDAGEVFKTLVMKTEQDRTTQSEYVYKQLETKQRDDQLEVLTVSVRYAEEHDNNSAELEKSGMNALFRKLTKLTRSEGVQLKKKTPRNNLRAFVDHIRTGDLSVKKLHSELAPLKTKIAEQRRQLKQKQTIVIGRVLTELNPLIEEAVRKEKTRRDIKALEKTCTEHLQRIVSKHVDMALREIFNETQSVVDNAVRFQELKQLPEFRDNFKDIPIHTNKNSGLFGLGFGALAGAVVGGIFGGPAGAALGASLGGGLGGAAGSALTGTKTERVNLGNNMQDVLAETMKIFSEAAHKTVDTAFAEMDNNFLKPIEQQAQTVNVALDRFVNILEKEVDPR